MLGVDCWGGGASRRAVGGGLFTGLDGDSEGLGDFMDPTTRVSAGAAVVPAKKKGWGG